MHTKRTGFSLVELLIVIAIIAVLAAILIPLLSFAREKSYQSKCMSNQRQIQTAINFWLQDHNQVLPDEKIWQNLEIKSSSGASLNTILRCPTDLVSSLNSYVYNAALINKPENAFPKPQTVVLTCDGRSGTGDANIAKGPEDVTFRHRGSVIATFLDGHAITTSDPRDLSIDLRPSPAIEESGDADLVSTGNWWKPPSSYLYGSKGYVLCGWGGADVKSLTGSYVADVTCAGGPINVWANDTSDLRALLNPTPNKRSAACWQGDATYTITLTSPDDKALHTVHLYLIDWDGQGRTLKLTGVDAGGKPLMKTNSIVSDFGSGVWITYKFRGNVSIKAVHQTGPNAVVSGFMFD